MNITDIFGNIKQDNSLSNKIAVKTEIKRIDRRVEDIATSVLDYVSSELDFIEKGCSYGNIRQFSDEEKKELTNKLKEAINSLPSKISSEINGLFSDEDTKEDKPEENKGEEAEVTITKQEVPPTITPRIFGY